MSVLTRATLRNIPENGIVATALLRSVKRREFYFPEQLLAFRERLYSVKLDYVEFRSIIISAR
jgi:hypothetical protein